MKMSIKALLSSLLTFVLVLSLSVTSFAADSSVSFNGHGKSFTFEPGSEFTESDLFDSFKGCMPGDKRTESITVTNNSADADYVKLYMRAEPHDEVDNPLSENVAATGETVASMRDFLSKLSMKVYNGEELIFQAPCDQLGGLTSNVLLGTFRQGETTTLTVELSVPSDLGNEYAKRTGEIDWIFLAESFDEPDDTTGPEDTTTPEGEVTEPDTPPHGDDTTLPEDTTAPESDESTIVPGGEETDFEEPTYTDTAAPDSTDKPDDDMIQTGALNWPVPTLLILGIILIALGAILVSRKKDDENA